MFCLQKKKIVFVEDAESRTRYVCDERNRRLGRARDGVSGNRYPLVCVSGRVVRALRRTRHCPPLRYRRHAVAGRPTRSGSYRIVSAAAAAVARARRPHVQSAPGACASPRRRFALSPSPLPLVSSTTVAMVAGGDKFKKFKEIVTDDDMKNFETKWPRFQVGRTRRKYRSVFIILWLFKC